MIKKLGIYPLGCRHVEVYTDTDSGGGLFDTAYDITRIIIGLNSECWDQCLQILLHEVVELVAVDVGARFQPTPDYSAGTDSYSFFMNHEKFSQIMARTSLLLIGAIPDLVSAYNKEHRAVRKRKTAKVARRKQTRSSKAHKRQRRK